MAVDDLAHLDRQPIPEHGPGQRHRVELAVLPAGVDRSRKVFQELGVEGAPDEAGVQLIGVDAGDDGTKAGVDHLMRQHGGGSAPQGEQGPDAGRSELFFPVGSDIGEEKVPEGHRLHPGAASFIHGLGHGRSVDLVAARVGKPHLLERQAAGLGLSVQHQLLDAVHGDAAN